MKKILFALLCLLSIACLGQSGDPLRHKLESIFQPVDKTLIPTGYLAEYGTEFTPLHWYNGLQIVTR